MSRELTLTIVDGVRVVVPDNLNHATPFVLQEQGDWFEDEIRFLRRAMRPGDKVVDIGANYGLYTLSIARTVGATGHVWAFEPATRTHAFLTRSVQANRFTNVTVERSAMSDHVGTGHLALSDQPELNALTQDGNASTEQVPLVTLDERMQTLGWSSIDFLKLDAEGAEQAILDGGRRFLTELSPLVQIELRTESTVNLSLLQTLRDLDYQPYRVVPGLGVLVPLDLSTAPDPYLLNALCCRPDRAAELAARDLLLDPAALPAVEPMDPDLMYRRSREPARPMRERLALLLASLRLLKERAAQQPGHMSGATLVCAARDAGERSVACEQLITLLTGLLEGHPPGLADDFTLPCDRYAKLPAGSRRRDWALACVTEALEQLSWMSSCYNPPAAMARLQMLERLGFLGPEMSRRLGLLKRREAQQPK